RTLYRAHDSVMGEAANGAGNDALHGGGLRIFPLHHSFNIGIRHTVRELGDRAVWGFDLNGHYSRRPVAGLNTRILPWGWFTRGKEAPCVLSAPIPGMAG